MKKSLILFLFLPLLSGCTKNGEIIHALIDYGYYWDFYIDNQIGNTIVLTYQNAIDPDEVNTILVEVGENKRVSDHMELGVKSKAKLEDDLPEDYKVAYFFLGYGYPFTMTIDGEAVPDEIWLRKYWSFKSDFYTLTVINELLLELLTLR